MLRDFQLMELLENLCKEKEVQELLVKNKEKYDLTDINIDDIISQRKNRILLENGDKRAFDRLKAVMVLAGLPLESLEYSLTQKLGYNGEFVYGVYATLTEEEYQRLVQEYDK